MRLNEAAEKLKSKAENASDFFLREDEFWGYYRSISGRIDDKYLDVYFTECRGVESIEISSFTDCEDEVREILSEWSDLIVEE